MGNLGTDPHSVRTRRSYRTMDDGDGHHIFEVGVGHAGTRRKQQQPGVHNGTLPDLIGFLMF